MLGQFGATKGRAQRRDAELVAAEIGRSPVWQDLKQQIYLGSDSFIERTLARVSPTDELTEVPRAQRRAPPRPLALYEKRHRDRHTVMVAAYRSGHHSLGAIARHFGVHYSTVSRAVSRWEHEKT